MRLPILPVITIVACLLGSACQQQSVSQSAKSEDRTWHDSLQSHRSVIEPNKIELLSIQVSKLPRNVFGHGKTPLGRMAVRSFVAASGTGLYGTFELDPSGELLFQEELSAIKVFVDDRGTDLTVNPSGEEIKTLFEDNKPLYVDLSNDQTSAIFTIRGLSTPAKEATFVTANVDFAFISFSEEKTETMAIKKFSVGEKVQLGPVEFVIEKALGNQSFISGRSVNPAFGDDQREWALRMQPRLKPVKLIELLDGDGQVIQKLGGLNFEGREYRHFLPKLEPLPSTVRVTWYDQWDLVTVPVSMRTSLGLHQIAQ